MVIIASLSYPTTSRLWGGLLDTTTPELLDSTAGLVFMMVSTASRLGGRGYDGPIGHAWEEACMTGVT